MLTVGLRDEVAKDRPGQTLAAMVGVDLQLGPRDMRVLRIVQAALGPAEGDYSSARVASPRPVASARSQ